MNALYCGDNLAVLRRRVASRSVDLIYLDPPFQSGKDYSLIFQAPGRAQALAGAAGPAAVLPMDPATARAHATGFTDTWAWGPEAERAYEQIQAGGGRPSVALAALRSLLGPSDALAYLCMMTPRLVELHRVLRPSGSLYLHCDPTASHYLKVLLDAIFGPDCFRNEVIWRYRRWPAKARRYQRMHDVILYYTARADGSHTFHTLYGYERLAASTLKTFGTRKQRADFSTGRRRPSVEAAHTPGPPLTDYWDVDPDDESPMPELSDAWEVGVIAAIGKERTGYPTQKPEALLERIVLASSNPGDVLLDPFCGSGTALAVAERLGRRWIGVDRSPAAVAMARGRLAGAACEVAREADPLDPIGPRKARAVPIASGHGRLARGPSGGSRASAR